MGFGTKKARFTGGGGFNNWGIKEGDNFVRFLPQMHSLADDDRGWAVYHPMHWGYEGVDPKDETKTKAKPFRCIKETDRRTDMVLQACPECDLIDQHKAKAEEIKATLTAKAKADGLNEKAAEDFIKTGMKPINEWLKAHRWDGKWYLGAKKGEEFGQFKIPHRMKKQLEALLEKHGKEDGIDGLALDQGLVFCIKRIGDGFGTPDTIEPAYEDVVMNGSKFKKLRQDPLTEDQATAALAKIEDLSKAGGLRLTFDQIQSLVDCSGDPEEVDAIIGTKKKEESAPAKATEPPKTTKSIDQVVKETQDTAQVVAENSQKAQEDLIAKRVADIKAAKAKKAAEEKAAAALAAKLVAEAAAAIEPGPVGDLNMDDEEFLKKYGG